MVAVSQAPSPESSPDSPLPVITMVGHYPTIELIGQEFEWRVALKRKRSALNCLVSPCPLEIRTDDHAGSKSFQTRRAELLSVSLHPPTPLRVLANAATLGPRISTRVFTWLAFLLPPWFYILSCLYVSHSGTSPITPRLPGSGVLKDRQVRPSRSPNQVVDACISSTINRVIQVLFYRQTNNY